MNWSNALLCYGAISMGVLGIVMYLCIKTGELEPGKGLSALFWSAVIAICVGVGLR